MDGQHMHIVVIGTGYVGLVSGACFAEAGHTVVCVDNDASKIAALKRGESTIHEQGLDPIISANVKNGRLSFTTDLARALKTAGTAFICVGTPARPGDGESDLSFVFQVARDIAKHASGPLVVVTKSTVPVGTGDRIAEILEECRPDIAFTVASNPEFLREGNAVGDFQKPDRIVIGSDDPHARQVLADIFAPLNAANAPVLMTRRRTAELMKYAANIFLAMKITFINEIADLCEKTGADVTEVARGIGLDSRIGPKFLQPGPGFGGSCLPKDVHALIQTSQFAGTDLRLLEAVAAANPRRKRNMARKIIAACDGSVRGKTVAVLGLTFKPDTDDMRDAPALAIIPALQDAGASIRAYDPLGMPNAERLLAGVSYARDAYECARGADVLVVITEWAEFGALDMPRLKQALASPTVVDLRNIWQPDIMRKFGFNYTSIGRS